MKASEKQYFQYYIVKNDNLFKFDFNKDYFALSYAETYRLWMYAEVFGIQSRQDMTKARRLWYRCQQCEKQKPF